VPLTKAMPCHRPSSHSIWDINFHERTALVVRHT
jgi:hypothetical protein